MNRDRWLCFAAGIVLGLLLGGSAVGTYNAAQVRQAHEREQRAIDEFHTYLKLQEAGRRAEEALKDVKKAKDR